MTDPLPPSPLSPDPFAPVRHADQHAEKKAPDQKLHEAPKVKPSHIRHVALAALIVFIAIAVIGIFMRVGEARKLRKDTDQNAVQTVSTIIAQPGAQSEDIALPGTVQAWHEAIIYARTSGYIKKWNADIGAHVKEGDVLAEIDAPDLDAQYHQAQADLLTAIANNKLAQITAKRNVELRKTDSVSQQTADQAVATAEADAATVASEQANLDHLQQEEDFKKVIAPFDGVVTQRNIDVGALVVGDTGGASGQDLFHIAQTDKLRVYVQVPELNVPSITPDLVAELHFPQNPQQAVTAKLSRTADALDPTTRTLLTELEVDNADGALMPGGYTDAHLKLPENGKTIILPVNVLLFRDVERVGIVKGDKVALQAVTIGRDFGKTVEITSGVSAGDTVVINPPDSLQDGQQVRPVDQKDQKDQSKASSSQSSQNDGQAGGRNAAAPQNNQDNSREKGDSSTDEKMTIDQSQTDHGANTASPADSSGQPERNALTTKQGNSRENEQSPDNNTGQTQPK